MKEGVGRVSTRPACPIGLGFAATACRRACRRYYGAMPWAKSPNPNTGRGSAMPSQYRVLTYVIEWPKVRVKASTNTAGSALRAVGDGEAHRIKG